MFKSDNTVYHSLTSPEWQPNYEPLSRVLVVCILHINWIWFYPNNYCGFIIIFHMQTPVCQMNVFPSLNPFEVDQLIVLLWHQTRRCSWFTSSSLIPFRKSCKSIASRISHSHIIEDHTLIIWSKMGVTKSICPLHYIPFFIIIKTHFTCIMLCSHLAGITAAELQRHLSNIYVIWNI